MCMALVNTDAIELRTYNLAEADRIAVCLTRSAGLVRAVAKGARKMKSRFGAALEPFTLIRLAFYERENRELVSISSAEILTNSLPKTPSRDLPSRSCTPPISSIKSNIASSLL